MTRGFVAGDPCGVARVARRQHVVIGGVRVLRRWIRAEIVCQAHAEPFLHQCDRRDAVLGAQMVERAALVVLAPASPVRE